MFTELHLQERLVGEDGQPCKAEAGEYPHNIGLITLARMKSAVGKKLPKTYSRLMSHSS